MKPTHVAPLVELTRGPIVESIHFGAIVVTDKHGQVLASYGDPETLTFMRSSSKPFQALPFIERDGDRAFHLETREVSVMCASHSGTDEHVRVVSGMQAKFGVSEADLMCGTHEISYEPTHTEMILRGEAPRPLRHNCSGKHTGMLGHCVMRGLPTADYININHPVQQTILATFAEMVGLSAGEVTLGIDGCSAPNFAVPLRNAAGGYARLCDPDELPPARADACQRIVQAMTSEPNMVGGPGRFDTLLMGLASGRILAKAGAEGYQAIGIMPGAIEPGSPALGIAFKVSDGDHAGRARPCAAIEVLRQLGALSKQDAEQLALFDAQPLYNYRNLLVGEMRPVFALQRHTT